MPQTSKGLLISFGVATFLSLIVPVFFSELQINYFIPPIIFLFYRATPQVIGWVSFCTGVFSDCLLGMPRVGFLGVSYFVASSLLYSKRIFFFKDNFSTVPLLTYFFSMISFAMQTLLCLLLDLPLHPITFTWILTECIVSPILDVSYATLFFSLPHFFFTQYYGTKQLKSRESTDYADT